VRGRREGHVRYRCIRLENLICLALARDSFPLDLAHAGDIAVEVALQGGIDGGVVDGNEVGDKVRPPQGEGHDRLGAHAVADERGPVELVVGDEGGQVGGEELVVVFRGVRGGAVVS
jgi:hypothetical protein